MRLKEVQIFSNQTDKQAEAIINQTIRDEDNLGVNFELMIENSVGFGHNISTRYTLVIHLYELTEYEESLMDGEDVEY